MLGVALAVIAIGGGGVFTASATDGSPSSFVPISPVRVLDTRQASSPVTTLGANATITLSFASNVPVDATGVALNITATGGTTSSFLTVYPTGAVQPDASSVNWSDSAAHPNAVVVQLGTNRSIDIFNASGTVDVIVDLNGYYVPSTGGGGQGPAGPPGAPGPPGAAGPPGADAPAAEYAVASVFVDRGSGPTRYSTSSVALGSPTGSTTSGSFRFSCSAAQEPCKISFGAAVISDQAGNAFVHPRLLIHKDSGTAITFCEYADGANNIAGLDQITLVPTLVAAETAMDTPLNMGIGGSLDCGSTQPPAGPDGVVTEIWVPAGFYDVAATFAFGPNVDLPPIEP